MKTENKFSERPKIVVVAVILLAFAGVLELLYTGRMQQLVLFSSGMESAEKYGSLFGYMMPNFLIYFLPMIGLYYGRRYCLIIMIISFFLTYPKQLDAEMNAFFSVVAFIQMSTLFMFCNGYVWHWMRQEKLKRKSSNKVLLK